MTQASSKRNSNATIFLKITGRTGKNPVALVATLTITVFYDISVLPHVPKKVVEPRHARR